MFAPVINMLSFMWLPGGVVRAIEPGASGAGHLANFETLGTLIGRMGGRKEF